MQAGDGANDAGERAGHRGIGDVGEVGLAADREVVDAGREGGVGLGDGAVEGDEGAAVSDAGDGESLAGEPRRYLGEVGAGEAELRAKLGWRSH